MENVSKINIVNPLEKGSIAILSNYFPFNIKVMNDTVLEILL